MKNIKITGARTHNLKNISIEVPKEQITVFSGISGSGKSSLAFDTIFAEGQRRYIENLSSYARQVIGVIEKPDVDSIEGIPPAISIDQKSIARSPRSTVGTVTEIYDYLRVLFAHFGEAHCTKCGGKVTGGPEEKIISDAMEMVEGLGDGTEVYAYVFKNLVGSHKSALERFSRSSFKKFILDNVEMVSEQLAHLDLDKKAPHTLMVRVGEISADDLKAQNVEKLERKVEKIIKQALSISDGSIEIRNADNEKLFSKTPYCEKCDIYFSPLQPRLFSFNSPYGACLNCQGLGVVKVVERDLVIPNKNLTISEGAIRPWARLSGQNGKTMQALKSLSQRRGFSLDVPCSELDEKSLNYVFDGDDEFEGVCASLLKKYKDTDSDYLRQEIEEYMVEAVCDECGGRRLNKFAESVLVFGKTISEISKMEALELSKFMQKQSLVPPGSAQLISQINKRLKNLVNMGLGYLSISRTSDTLSGGESQRLRLSTQFDSFLSGVLYVLDEPTISLHPADTLKLINSFKKLKEEGNTVLIVEHDRDVLGCADKIVEIGPGAGKNGGEIIFEGTVQEMLESDCLTGRYLSGKQRVGVGKILKNAKTKQEKIVIRGARHNNLKNIDVEIPLKKFVSVTGPSGSGKSSLVYDILALALARKLYNSQKEVGEHDTIDGLEKIEKSIVIDQAPIGRTPRSNLATYTGIFTPIRELFAQTQSAKNKKFQASRFSFNLKGGRCEVCRGEGSIKMEMYFMPDVYVPCEECGGKRYNSETLEIKYMGKSIFDILQMSVDEAYDFFEADEDIRPKLDILKKVGLGYLALGQSATSLSGGEAQRIKLASELSKNSSGNAIYILDEPTTGLHFDDIRKLLLILKELVLRGNSVVVIEHNVDVISDSDYIIDMGPSGGAMGGYVVSCGTPEDLKADKNSITGSFINLD